MQELVPAGRDEPAVRSLGCTAFKSDYSVVVMKTFVSLLCMVETSLPSKIYLKQFMVLGCMLDISLVTG